MALTIKEKEHWKESLERRIQRAIEQLYRQGAPDLRSRIEQQSRQLAIDSLGISKEMERREVIQKAMAEMDQEKHQLNQNLTTKLKDEIAELRHTPYYDTIDEGVRLRQKVFRQELLAQDAQGKQILQLEQEKENLLDTVWLATSPNQIKELWSHVLKMLGQPLSELQQDACAIPAVDDTPSE